MGSVPRVLNRAHFRIVIFYLLNFDLWHSMIAWAGLDCARRSLKIGNHDGPDSLLNDATIVKIRN